jgi:two-component system, chemotaxis family, response regulator Rcp1
VKGSPNERRPAEILLIEDNLADARLTMEILREGPIPKVIRTVRDGDEALACLRRKGAFAGAARPDLIILDLNLPLRDGREVLAEVKSDPDLRRIPVVVLTTSGADLDIRHAYDLHANCYILKPLGLEAFRTTLRAMEEFWLSVARLPGSD